VQPPRKTNFVRIHPFVQLWNAPVAREDPAMPGVRARRGASRRRPWAASLVVAAALAGAVVPVAQAAPGGDKPPWTCGEGKGDAAQAQIDRIMARAREGVVVPAGAIDPPALTVGRAADVQVRMGADPLGIATILRQDPEQFWATARATVSAAGAGVAKGAYVRSDGSATLSLTPTAAGAITMRLYVPGRAIMRAIGPCAPPVRGVGSPLVRPGDTPGSPVLPVEDLPVQPPNPGPEPAPVPGPEPAPAL
jgi:hypothetical protein